MSLEGKVAIVTGGSAGIGLALAEKLVARGVTVVMVARTRETLEREAARLGPRAIPWPLDVGDLPAVAELPAAVVARLGRLDIVVNNAGLHHRGPLMKHPPLAFADMVAVNLSAPIVLSRAALPLLPEGGVIVNVASLAGRTALPEAATYSATKAGLRFFGRALAEEQSRVRVSTVSPGPVDTGFFGDLVEVSDIVFSQPMSTAAVVADACLRAIEGPSAEIAMPAFSGWLTTLGYLSPWLSRLLRPLLTARGAKAKAAYMARKGA